jgi:nitrate/TMAO reductase-like tetraheme cytochrome c subunit
MSDAKHLRKWLGLVVPMGTIFLLGLVLLLNNQPAQAQTNLGNDACLACHSAPGQILTLPNGDTLSISVDTGHYGSSVHGAFNCTTCHTDILEYPHPQRSAQTAREYAQLYKETCRGCHATQYDTMADSMHGQLSAAGNLNAPLCADCHDPHAQKALRDTQGNLMPAERLNIPQTCARCHSTIYNEYAASVHGSALSVNNTDVATCTDCHGVHLITDPRNEAFRLSSVQTCANCHTDPEKMAKYGLSTAVLDTYISDFHGTTVTLFEKRTPDDVTNKPVCFDCHGVHDIRAVKDPKKGLSIRANLMVTCQRCHPDANLNFPDSWLSHYIPTPDRYPIVYYVNLIYLILIPLVLGAMLLFILSDIYHRLRTRGKGKAHTAGGVAAKAEIPTAPTQPAPVQAAEIPTTPRQPVEVQAAEIEEELPVPAPAEPVDEPTEPNPLKNREDGQQ